MTVRAEDLPPALRKRLGLTKGAGNPGGPRAKKDPGGPVRCHTCQEVFPQYGRKDGWEAHSDASGHSRAEAILTREAR